jgi:hypothetical protein
MAYTKFSQEFPNYTHFRKGANNLIMISGEHGLPAQEKAQASPGKSKK